MDKLTKNYREVEYNAISMRHPLYKAQIKIMDNHGETKWLSITDTELEAITKVLKGGFRDGLS